MSKPSRYVPLLVAAAVSCAAALTGCATGLGQEDMVSFTPPPAQQFPEADCTVPETVMALSDIGLGAQSRELHTTPGAGSIPEGFAAEQVIRCERAEDPAGNITIDAVTLVGDIDAVSEAFALPSERSPDGTSISCAYAEEVAAGLWLIAADGSAIRPQWPTTACGYQDEPLAALKGLTEAARETVSIVGSVNTPGQCPESTGYEFRATSTDSDGSEKTADLHDFSLMVPVDDVAGLTVCRYDVQSSDIATVLTGSQGLSAEVSRQAVESAFAAPPAGACSQTATEVVAMRLVRPDGSGGGVFLAEANGCERFMVPGLTGYRAMPPEALALLDK